MIYNNATVANERASKKLSIELKNIESQQHRHMVKLYNTHSRIKSALSMPSLRAEPGNTGFLNPSLSPRTPSSLPVSPVTSPRVTRRRHSEIIPSSTATLLEEPPLLTAPNGLNKSKSDDQLDKPHAQANVRDCLGLSRSIKGAASPRVLTRSSVHPMCRSQSSPTERLDQLTKEFSGVGIKGAVSPRVVRRFSVHPVSQNVETSVNSEGLAQGGRSRRRLSAGCASLKAIDENRNNLDQRIKKFHESLKALKGEKQQTDHDNPDDSEGTPDLNNNIPKLPEIKPNSKRSNSLPTLIPRLSLANLKCEPLLGDGHHDDLQRCRYLRIQSQDDLEVDDVF